MRVHVRLDIMDKGIRSIIAGGDMELTTVRTQWPWLHTHTHYQWGEGHRKTTHSYNAIVDVHTGLPWVTETHLHNQICK